LSINQRYWAPLPSRALCHGTLPSRSLKKARVSSPEVQGTEFAVHSPCCPKYLQLHHFMVTADKVALQLHIPHQSLLVGENKLQHNTSPCWLLGHLEKDVIINAFQKVPGLLDH